MGSKGVETIVIKNKDAPDITIELAKYLDILGSPVRLKVLKILELEPLDTESISHQLYKIDVRSSRENTEKHLKKLLRAGLVRKEPGEKHNRAVMNFVLVPGSIENAMRTIKKVLKLELSFEIEKAAKRVAESLSKEFGYATVKVLGGLDDGREFPLRKAETKVGRVDPVNTDKYDPENDVVLSDYYGVVSRVWKPHALLSFDDNNWYLEHCEGKNQTSLWDRQLEKGRKERLKHGDIINLAVGEKGARLVFLMPRTEKE